VWREIFLASLISQILDFSGYAGKKSEFGFQTLVVGLTFRGFHVQYLKVTKMKATWSFATKVQQCKKGIFVGGSFFSQDLIIRDQ